ncbi:hypothetical protein CapIbe_013325 [Capra ibex]
MRCLLSLPRTILCCSVSPACGSQAARAVVSGPASVCPSSTLPLKRACDLHQPDEGAETQLKDSRWLGPPAQKQAPWKAPGAPRPTAASQIPCPHRPHPGKGQGAAGAATIGQGRAASWRPLGLELFHSRRGTENCGNVLRAGQSGPGPAGRGLLQGAQAHGVLGAVVQRELARAVGGWGAVWGRKEEAMRSGGGGRGGWSGGRGAWSHSGRSHFASPGFGL